MKNLSLIALIIVFLFSCKKKDETPADLQNILCYQSGKWLCDSIVATAVFSNSPPTPTQTSKRLKPYRYQYFADGYQFSVYDPYTASVGDNSAIRSFGFYTATSDGKKIQFRTQGGSNVGGITTEINVVDFTLNTYHTQVVENLFQQKITTDSYFSRMP